MNQLSYSDAGMALTQKSEGFKLDAYQDVAGVWTIGYGHTAGVDAGMSCTEAQALYFLLEDLKGAENCVNQAVTVPLAQNQFDALVDFAFNLGCHALRSSTLLKLVNEQNFTDAAQEFDKWVMAGGKRVWGLVKRRAAERAMFEGMQ